MEYSQKIENDILYVTMEGSFTFSDNQAFRSIAEDVPKHSIVGVELDFSGVDYVDSAALGMLLLLRDITDKKHIPVSIKGVTSQVKKVFDVSRFDQLFKIS